MCHCVKIEEAKIFILGTFPEDDESFLTLKINKLEEGRKTAPRFIFPSPFVMHIFPLHFPLATFPMNINKFLLKILIS